MPSNVFPLHLKQIIPPIILIFTEVKGDEIESRLHFKIFSTLLNSEASWVKIASKSVLSVQKIIQNITT